MIRNRIDVFYDDKNSSDWPATNPIKFIQWFQEKIDLIPDEFKESASIEISSDDAGVPEIDIYYYRPENEEETEKRLSRLSMLEYRKKQNELKQLKYLKEKYEVSK